MNGPYLDGTPRLMYASACLCGAIYVVWDLVGRPPAWLGWAAAAGAALFAVVGIWQGRGRSALDRQ